MTHSLTSSDIKQFQSYLMDSNVKLNTVKKYVRDVKKLAHFLSDQTQTLSQNSLDAFLKSLPEAGYAALLRTALEQKNYRQVLMIQIFAVTDIRMKELAVEAGIDPDKVYPQNLKRQLVRSHFSVTYP